MSPELGVGDLLTNLPNSDKIYNQGISTPNS